MANTIGRWIAATFDFRFTGLTSLAVVVVFILLKARGDPAAVSTTSCLSLAFSVFTVISATNAGRGFSAHHASGAGLAFKRQLGPCRCGNSRGGVFAIGQGHHR